MYFGSEMLDLPIYLPTCISAITPCNSAMHTRLYVCIYIRTSTVRLTFASRGRTVQVEFESDYSATK